MSTLYATFCQVMATIRISSFPLSAYLLPLLCVFSHSPLLFFSLFVSLFLFKNESQINSSHSSIPMRSDADQITFALCMRTTDAEWSFAETQFTQWLSPLLLQAATLSLSLFVSVSLSFSLTGVLWRLLHFFTFSLSACSVYRVLHSLNMP